MRERFNATTMAVIETKVDDKNGFSRSDSRSDGGKVFGGMINCLEGESFD